MVKIEVDEQLEEARMSPRVLTEAMNMFAGSASLWPGGVAKVPAQEMAVSGVDLISVGWCIHSVPTVNIRLDFAG